MTGRRRVPAEDILKHAEKLGLLEPLKKLIKQGKKLDDIDLHRLRQANPRAGAPNFDRDALDGGMPRHGANGDRTTYGRGMDSNGNEYSTRSGNKRDDADQIDAVNDRLRERGIPYRSGNAHHAEQKFAGRMANEGIDDADLVINNPSGPCLERLGCDQTVGTILKPGQTLRVHWRGADGAWQMTPFVGEP
ncbi:MAG TPA: DddA-like double-stranded DNA deaminase toxin [Candidatus Limnocylindrales bacterium]